MGMMGHDGGSGHEHGGSGMMQQCMDMMNSMMGGASDASGAMSTMGLDLSLSLAVVLILVGTLGYLLGRSRVRA